jgi:hypothetical protein
MLIGTQHHATRASIQDAELENDVPYIHTNKQTYICIYVCMFVWLLGEITHTKSIVIIYIYIYIYIYTYTYTDMCVYVCHVASKRNTSDKKYSYNIYIYIHIYM